MNNLTSTFLLAGRATLGRLILGSKGGKTEPANCRMLCMIDNRTKSGK